jgi:hypothetical protein
MGCVDTSLKSPFCKEKTVRISGRCNPARLRMSFPKWVTGKARALRELLMGKDDQAEAGRRTWVSGL